MKRLILLCLFLAGCETTSPTPHVVVTPTGPATAAQLAAQEATIEALKAETITAKELAQRASGGVYGGAEANVYNPDGLPKEAVAAQLAEAASALPEPTDAQKLEKANQNARILAGELAAVKAEMGQTISENEALKAKLSAEERRAVEAEAKASKAEAAAEKERAEAAAKLQKQFDAMTARIKAAQDEAANAVAKQQVTWLNRIGAGAVGLLVLSVGLASVFGGIAALRAVAPFALILFITALTCFGLAQIVGAAWFKWAVLGSGALVTGVGGWWVWSKYKADTLKVEAEKQAGKLKGVLVQTVPVLDKAYNNASEEVKKFMDEQIFTPLNSKMDKADKVTVHEVRAAAETTAEPATP